MMEVLPFPPQGCLPRRLGSEPGIPLLPPLSLDTSPALHYPSDAGQSLQALPSPFPPVTETLAPGEGLPSTAPGLCPLLLGHTPIQLSNAWPVPHPKEIPAPQWRQQGPLVTPMAWSLTLPAWHSPWPVSDPGCVIITFVKGCFASCFLPPDHSSSLRALDCHLARASREVPNPSWSSALPRSVLGRHWEEVMLGRRRNKLFLKSLFTSQASSQHLNPPKQPGWGRGVISWNVKEQEALRVKPPALGHTV